MPNLLSGSFMQIARADSVCLQLMGTVNAVRLMLFNAICLLDRGIWSIIEPPMHMQALAWVQLYPTMIIAQTMFIAKRHQAPEFVVFC